jgi:hypothetical protein
VRDEAESAGGGQAVRSSRFSPVTSLTTDPAFCRPRSVRLIDNSSDSSSSDPSGPTTLYDSSLDPSWPGNSSSSSHPRNHSPNGGCHCNGDEGREGKVWVDAKGFVEGRLEQREDGSVVERRPKEGNGKEGRL